MELLVVIRLIIFYYTAHLLYNKRKMQDCDICFEKYNPKCALPYPCPTPKCNEVRNVCSLCSTNINKCPFCRSVFSKKEEQKKDNHIPSPVVEATPAVMPIGWDIPIPEGPLQNFQYTYPQSEFPQSFRF